MCQKNNDVKMTGVLWQLQQTLLLYYINSKRAGQNRVRDIHQCKQPYNAIFKLIIYQRGTLV